MTSTDVTRRLEEATLPEWAKIVVGVIHASKNAEREIKARCVYVSPQVGKPEFIRINVLEMLPSGELRPWVHFDQVRKRFNSDVDLPPYSDDKMQSIFQMELRRLVKSSVQTIVRSQMMSALQAINKEISDGKYDKYRL